MSDSDSEVEETEQEMKYRFKIVKFIKRGRKGSKKEIDIVPAEWIHWDNKTKRLKVPFLPTPYTNEDIKELHKIVKSECEAPESWPLYNVDIIGESRTYTDAVSRLLLLEKTDTAFSQDSEDDTEKIKRAEIAYRQKTFKKTYECARKSLNKPKENLIEQTADKENSSMTDLDSKIFLAFS
ncbi:PREDICTED: uncharacterized protein LOC105457027 [Wasmannia auropunctata]|uniref:uncharacterized protein LOC105457027 n=1 Tax=Wasmannia auropunctata TaxID=64793 RepID=UPI0005EE2090|nr:PREDICTED: uncharacterized protein LOC105457027 [Wasmannia auropunctata]